MSRKREASEDHDGNGHGFVRQKKKLRTYTASDAELAKHYEALANEVNDTRIKAATELIKNVQGRVSDAANSDELEATRSPLQSQRKIYVRLVRGLCSSRKAARMGFSIALTELLRLALDLQIDERIEDAIALIEEYTESDGGASSQEKRDYALGRVSAYSAMLRCGALQASPTSHAVRRVADQFFKLFNQVPWLREECGLVLCEAVEQPGESTSGYVRAIIDAMVAAGVARSPEGVVIWLRAMQHHPDVKLPKDVWHHRNPLHKKELVSVFKIIRQNVIEGPGDMNNAANSHSGARRHSPHFAWAAVLRHITAFDHEDALFEKFWQETFDDYFFGKATTPEKKALGFQNFARAISWATPSKFVAMFSKNFMTSLVNQSAQPQRYLHAAARSTLGAIVRRAGMESDSKATCALVSSLLTRNGTLSFDRATGTKTIHDLLATVNASVFEVLVEDVFLPLIKPDILEAAKDVAQKRQTVCDLLLSAVRSRDIAGESPEFDEPHWIWSLLKQFSLFSFSTEELPESTRSMITSKLFAILSHILSSGTENAFEYPAWVVQFLTSGEAELQIFKDCDDAVRDTLEQARITFEKLIAIPSLETADEDSPERSIIRLLFSMTMLQAYSAETDAIELLSDLQQCYIDVLGRGNAKARGVEAIVDIIMDFASRQSALHRKLAEEVFAAFAPNLTTASMSTMLEVLEQKESVAGQQALFDRGADEEAADEDEESESDQADTSDNEDSALDDAEESDSEDDDVEVVDTASDIEELNGEASPSGSNNNSDDDDDDEGDDPDELAQFDALLASALGTKVTDDASSSDSDADMDDEQMMALEPHLAAIFRERAAAAASTDGKPTQKKAEHRSAKENITAFKNRVLDLLLIYVRRCADQPLALEIVLPLLTLIRSTGSKQLTEKAHSLLRQYFDLAKKKGWGDSRSSTSARDVASKDVLRLETRLADIHAEALRFASKAHAAACSSASLFMARGLLHVGLQESSNEDPKTVRDAAMGYMIELYAQTHKRRCQSSGQGGLPASFWEDWVRWSLQVAHQ